MKNPLGELRRNGQKVGAAIASKWDSLRALRRTTGQNETTWDDLAKEGQAEDSASEQAEVSERTVGQEIERNHFAAEMPSLQEQMADTSRTTELEFQVSEHAEGIYTKGENETIKLDEYSALNTLDEYLQELSDNEALTEQQRTEMAALRESLNYIGTKEFAEATAGLAEYYKNYLDADAENHLVIRLMSDDDYHSVVKSDVYVLDQILANFSEEDLQKYAGRLHRELDEENLLPPEHTKIVVLDDWSISGEQMMGVQPQMMAMDMNTGEMEVYDQEINLLIAKRRQLEKGFKYFDDDNDDTMRVPVRSYFVAREDERFQGNVGEIGSVRTTGFYSSVDYGFEFDISAILRQHPELNLGMPPLTNIIRPYRQPGYVPQNVIRAGMVRQQIPEVWQENLASAPGDAADTPAEANADSAETSERLSERLAAEYRGYAELLLARAGEISAEEQADLPADWQETLQDLLALLPDTDGQAVREAYRKMQNQWEATVMRKEILRRPDQRGVGEVKVIDGRNNLTAEELFANLNPRQRELFSLEQVRARLEVEAAEHRAEFTEFLDSFDGKLQRGRVCPAPEYSPFSLMNVEQADGSIRVDPEFVKDIQQMREHGMTDINLVASFATRAESGRADMSLPDAGKYCAMIEALVREVGTEGLTISIGNETNESMSSNPDGKDDMDDLPVSQEIAPAEYAEFYCQVAAQLKKDFPDLKLCTAGTTFLAPNYTRKVLEEIEARSGGQKLVDRIDFHPYRTDVDEAAVSHTEDKYGDVAHKADWKYNDYEDELIGIAEEYGAELIMGEVQFGGGEAPGATIGAHRKLTQALDESNRKGITCNVWPRVGLPF